MWLGSALSGSVLSGVPYDPVCLADGFSHLQQGVPSSQATGLVLFVVEVSVARETSGLFQVAGFAPWISLRLSGLLGDSALSDS